MTRNTVDLESIISLILLLILSDVEFFKIYYFYQLNTFDP